MSWYVYMLRCGDGSLYTGCTNHIDRRLHAHQSGKGAKYTRSRLPVVLEYQEMLSEKSAALRREAEIKKLTRQQKLLLIQNQKEMHMVEMRRKDRQLSKELAWSIVERCEYAVLSMVTEEHMPYSVPITIVRVEDAVYFHSAMEGRKADCLRKNPHVCLSCVGKAEVCQEKFTTLYESAVVFGAVSEIMDAEEKREILRRLCLRHTPDAMSRFECELTANVHHTAVWKVTVQELSGKSNR